MDDEGSAGPGRPVAPVGLFHALLDALFQPACLACDKPATCDGLLCDLCRSTLRPLLGGICRRCGEPLRGATDEDQAQAGASALCAHCEAKPPACRFIRGAVVHGRVGRSLVHALKYHQRLDVLPFMADWLMPVYWQDVASWQPQVVVPVPLHPWRQWQRGYNQAAELASAWAPRLELPVIDDALLRVNATVSQVGKSRRQRLVNLRQCFAAGPSIGMVGGRRVLLVDDVATTGSTLEECARTLVSLGASEVAALVFSRASAGGGAAPALPGQGTPPTPEKN